MALTVVILAAGQGSRICSEKSKVLQNLAGKTLIRHVVETVESLKAKNIIIVQGYLGRQVQKELSDKKEHKKSTYRRQMVSTERIQKTMILACVHLYRRF